MSWWRSSEVKYLHFLKRNVQRIHILTVAHSVYRINILFKIERYRLWVHTMSQIHRLNVLKLPFAPALFKWRFMEKPHASEGQPAINIQNCWSSPSFCPLTALMDESNFGNSFVQQGRQQLALRASPEPRCMAHMKLDVARFG